MPKNENRWMKLNQVCQKYFIINTANFQEFGLWSISECRTIKFRTKTFMSFYCNEHKIINGQSRNIIATIANT